MITRIVEWKLQTAPLFYHTCAGASAFLHFTMSPVMPCAKVERAVEVEVEVELGLPECIHEDEIPYNNTWCIWKGGWEYYTNGRLVEQTATNIGSFNTIKVWSSDGLVLHGEV